MSPESLAARLEARGSTHRLDYALSRLALIQELPFKKIDTTELTPEEVAQAIEAHILATT